MPTISTVAQGGAQRSEQYLKARTGEGARVAAFQPAQVLQSGSPQGTEATLTTDARAAQRERAPAAQRRLSVTLGVERDRTARKCGSGAKATGRE